jgi:hypothetical protein
MPVICRGTTKKNTFENENKNYFIRRVKPTQLNFSFDLLKINGLYIFRTLLAYPRRRSINNTPYIACVLYNLAAVQPNYITRTQYRVIEKDGRDLKPL